MILTFKSEFPVDTEALFAFCTSTDGFVRHFPMAVRWHTGPARWGADDVLDFSFRTFGIWSRYVARITQFVPGISFTDEMQSGIYRRCAHTHEFRAQGTGTVLVDIVDFSLGYGGLADRLIGLPLITRTFRRRHDLLERHFGGRIMP